jgi:putative ABC transport system permease protein
LVFAMMLDLAGLANGFRVEAQWTVDSMGVDRFVVKAGAAGPFLGSTSFAAQIDLARGWPVSPASPPRPNSPPRRRQSERARPRETPRPSAHRQGLSDLIERRELAID